MGSDVRAVTIKCAKLADEYERVHFIGHAEYNPDLTAGMFLEKAGEIADDVCARTGYIAFVRDIKVKHFPPKMTDVDFVIDCPAGSPVPPIIIVAVIAVLILAVAAVAYVVWMFWTTWTEKYEVYYCDQCEEYPEFKGWRMYLAHLAEFHPKKYEAAKDEEPWWEKIMLPIGILLLLGLAIMVAPKLIPERRRE